MARFPRTLADALAAQAEAGRSTRTEALSVDGLAPISLGNLNEDLKNNLDTLNTDLEQATLDLVGVGQKLTELDGSLIALDGDMTQAKQDLTGLSTELTGIDGTITDLIADMEIAQSNQALFQTNLDGLNGDLATLDTALTGHGQQLTELDASLTANSQELSQLQANVAGVDDKIAQAIDDANAQPITSDRFTEDSLSIWPFIQGTIPHGALSPGAVSSNDLADFVITARKFNDDRHRIY